MQADTGADMNVQHLQAHVPCQLSHVSEHPSAWHGLMQLEPQPWPPLTLKYDLYLCFYNLHTMGQKR